MDPLLSTTAPSHMKLPYCRSNYIDSLGQHPTTSFDCYAQLTTLQPLPPISSVANVKYSQSSPASDATPNAPLQRADYDCGAEERFMNNGRLLNLSAEQLRYECAPYTVKYEYETKVNDMITTVPCTRDTNVRRSKLNTS